MEVVLRIAAMFVALVFGLGLGLAFVAAVGLVLVRRMDPRRELEALAGTGHEARRHGWFRRSARTADRRIVRVMD